MCTTFESAHPPVEDEQPPRHRSTHPPPLCPDRGYPSKFRSTLRLTDGGRPAAFFHKPLPVPGVDDGCGGSPPRQVELADLPTPPTDGSSDGHRRDRLQRRDLRSRLRSVPRPQSG